MAGQKSSRIDTDNNKTRITEYKPKNTQESDIYGPYLETLAKNLIQTTASFIVADYGTLLRKSKTEIGIMHIRAKQRACFEKVCMDKYNGIFFICGMK